MVDTPVVRFWGEIILLQMAPEELVLAIKMADKPISRAATTCRFPKRLLALVSEPERKHANQPSQADKNGKALPTEDSVRPIV